MKSQLLTTIQQAFPGKDVEDNNDGYSFSVAINEDEDITCAINQHGYLMIHSDTVLGGRLNKIYHGHVPTENGEPDWDFIRKVLVNWKSF